MNRRAGVPTDLTDLTLAPAALALSGRLQELGELPREDLVRSVALSTDHDPVRGRHGELLLMALHRDVDVHEWKLSWDPRGLRMDHHGHSLVLGVSPALRDFLRQDQSPR